MIRESFLEFLDAKYNRLATLPPEIGILENLTHICLFRNELAYLPPEVANLRNCKSLEMHDQYSRVFPLNIECFPALEKLWVTGSFKYIPDRVFGLTTLKHLWISTASGAGVKLSERIGNLTELEILHLSDVKSAPESTGRLTKLQNLTLDGKELSTLPKSLELLENLQKLYVPSEALKGMPDLAKRFNQT